MKTITNNEAEQNVGQIFDTALHQPIRITKNGQPSLVITSDAEYQELLRFKLENLKSEVTKGFNSFANGTPSSRTVEQIAEDALRRHTQNS